MSTYPGTDVPVPDLPQVIAAEALMERALATLVVYDDPAAGEEELAVAMESLRQWRAEQGDHDRLAQLAGAPGAARLRIKHAQRRRAEHRERHREMSGVEIYLHARELVTHYLVTEDEEVAADVAQEHFEADISETAARCLLASYEAQRFRHRLTKPGTRADLILRHEILGLLRDRLAEDLKALDAPPTDDAVGEAWNSIE